MRPYTASTYELRLQEVPYGCCQPALSAADAEQIEPFLAGPSEELAGGFVSCTAIDAATAASIEAELLGVPHMVTGGGARFIVRGPVDVDIEQRTYVITLRALFPDESGCAE